MSKVKLADLPIEELRSRHFDAWTHYQDVKSRFGENKAGITEEMVNTAFADLKVIAEELKKRRT